jgi:hypothetical protein
MQTLELRSFDGSTLLGFLASVGALRLLGECGVADARLAFDAKTSHARLAGSAEDLQSKVVKGVLADSIVGPWTFRDAKGAVLTQPSDMTVEDVARERNERLLQKKHRRYATDVLGAVVAGEPTDEGTTESTELRAVGGGQLQFFKQIASLTDELDEEQITRTLTQPWTHGDKAGGLRLTPEEDRSYALRASDPSPEGASGERAANVLALLGHTLFPVLPQRGGATVGFDQKTNEISWALWDGFVALATEQALLPRLASASRDDLEAVGVFRVMRARRVTRGKYRNFSPAQPVW